MITCACGESFFLADDYWAHVRGPSINECPLRATSAADEVAANDRGFPLRDASTRDTYICKRCGKAWRRGGDPDVSCLVMHAPGTCCHYGDTEIVLDDAMPRCGWG